MIIKKMANGEETNEKSLLIGPENVKQVPAWGKRHVVVIVSFMGMFVGNILRTSLNVALVVMVNETQLPEPSNISSSQDTCPEMTASNSVTDQEGEFNWDATTQGLVLGSFFYGTPLTHLLGGQLAQYFGGRPLFAAGLGITSIIALIIPVLTRAHVNLLIAARLVQGIAFGVVFPSSSVLLSKWAPMSEKSRFCAIAFSGKNVGAAFAVAVTGFLSNTQFAGGWPSSFYVFGALGLLWVLALLWFTVENPEQHKNISSEELRYILQTTGSREKREKTPWRSVMTSGPVWAMVLGHTSLNWAFYGLVTTLPTYLKQVLRFNISENGLVSALPYLCMTCVEILGSILADYLLAKKVFSILSIRRIFSALGCFPACAFIFAEGFVGCNQVAAVVLLCLATGMLGFASLGFMINLYDIAPRHAGTIGGISNTFATMPGFLAPSVVMAITDNKPNFTRWRWAFILSSLIYTLGGAVSIIFTQAEEQPWAKSETEGHQNKLQTIIH